MYKHGRDRVNMNIQEEQVPKSLICFNIYFFLIPVFIQANISQNMQKSCNCKDVTVLVWSNSHC